MNKITEWLFSKGRIQLIILGVFSAMLLSMFFTLGLFTGIEFVDSVSRREKMDWSVIGVAMIGGVIGQVIQIVVVNIVTGIF